ncbi:hypothetical protein [Bdellovibrio sp. HCB274]|uniref:hypothetical protein n=1 Tax=Bdellovibrio sp. HCB274 TaxID=3394361 RepID=UPI0039B4D2BD
MKIVTAIIGLMFMANTVYAQVLPADIQSLKGELLLQNEDGKEIPFRSGLVNVEINRPSKATSPLRWMKKELVLKIQDADNTFLFRIPKSALKGENSFKVSRGDSEQNAQVNASFSRQGYDQQNIEEAVSCTYAVHNHIPVTLMDGNGNYTTTMEMQTTWEKGSQLALVKKEQWTETIEIQIRSKTGEVTLRTQPQEKVKTTTLKTLQSCR